MVSGYFPRDVIDKILMSPNEQVKRLLIPVKKLPDQIGIFVVNVQLLVRTSAFPDFWTPEELYAFNPKEGGSDVP